MAPQLPLGSSAGAEVDDALAEAERQLILTSPTADIFVRSGAALLDAILIWLVFSALTQVAKTIEGAMEVGFLASLISPTFWFLKAFFASVYSIWTLNRFGGTPAKILLGLQVVDMETGERLTFSHCVIREVGKVISIVTLAGFVIGFVRPDRRMLHDLAANSVVKRIHDGL